MAESGSPRLGSHLKKLREERKLTLGAVEALSVGFGERIAKSYLFRVERGKTFPSLPRLRVLAQVYQVKLARLLEALESAVEEQELAADLGIDVSSATFEELRKRGIEADKRGDFTKAALLFKAAWERALLEDPSNQQAVHVGTARLDLSIAYRNAGRLELAREEAEAALELAPRPSEVLDKSRLQLASVYRRMGRSALAEDVLEVLLRRGNELEPEVHAGAQEVMGSIFLNKQPRKAVIHYRSALAIQRKLKNRWEECILLYNLGLAESKSKRYDYALKRLSEAEAVANRQNFNFWICKIQGSIGKNLYLKGDRRAALAAFRKSNERARRGDYYTELFVNHYYLRQMAREDGDIMTARASEASLRYFSTRLDESLEELDAFKNEQREEKQ
jgi:tetratricopeptide (TPR) repeat protein